MKPVFLSLLMLASLPLLYGQDFVNGSFEGESQDAVIPVGWHICPPNTTPDIFPGVWGVFKESADGNTYVGLITRPDGSYESIGQRIPLELKTGQCYQLGFFLSHSDQYAGFSDPIVCRIWLGKQKGERGQLIFESKAVDDTDWQEIDVNFRCKKEWKYIIIEASFPEENLKAKGNILIDGLGAIKPCDQA